MTHFSLLLPSHCGGEKYQRLELLSTAVFAYHLIYNTVPSASHNQLKDGGPEEAPYQSQKFTSKERDAFEDCASSLRIFPENARTDLVTDRCGSGLLQGLV